MAFNCALNSNTSITGDEFICKILEYAYTKKKMLVFRARIGADASRRLLFIFRVLLNKLFQVSKAVPNKQVCRSE